MTGLPYQEMEPINGAVSPAEVTLDGLPREITAAGTELPSRTAIPRGEARRTTFALRKPGETCLIYTPGVVAGKVTLAPGRNAATRVDSRDGTQPDIGQVTGGVVDFSLPQGDWDLIYRRTVPSAK